jgi:precorrin-6B methylase 2
VEGSVYETVVLSLLLILISIALISISWPALRGAPWVPTPRRVVHKMLEMAEVGPDDLLVDLGCGDGRLLISAARRCGARAVGIEIDPLRYAWCRMLVSVLGLQDQVRIVHGDLFAQDLREASVVTCYLLQGTNQRLQEKLRRELAPGTRVVSNTFTFPELHLVRRDEKYALYLYRLDG